MSVGVYRIAEPLTVLVVFGPAEGSRPAIDPLAPSL
jgi:hypothetical protein